MDTGTRTYYIEQYGGFLDHHLPVVRRMAMDFLLTHAEPGSSVIIYTSSSRRRIVGIVKYDPHAHCVLWWMETTNRGRVVEWPLRPDGTIPHTRP